MAEWNRRFNDASSVVTVIRLGTVTYLKVGQWRDEEKLLSAWDPPIDVCITIILETSVQVTKSAKSMVARILITDYFMQKELLCIKNHNAEVQTEQLLYHQWRTTKQKQPSRKAEGVPVMLIRHI